MKHSTLRLGGYGLFVLAAVAACSTDERSLSYEFRAVESAGAPASAGRANAGDTSTAGDSGEPSAPQAGATSSAGGARGSNAGAASSSAGAAGEAGASMEDAGAAGAAGSESGGSGHGGAGGSTATGGGHAGGSATACGDLNQDSIDDCQQSLVQNAQFDSAVTGWDSEPSTTAVWDPTDGAGKPGSGSIRVSNSSAMVQAPGVTVNGSRQCIPVTPTGTYYFAARVMLPAGQSDGQGAVNVWFYDDDQCRGNLVTGATPILGGKAGEWQTLRSNLWVPGGVHSMFVRLVAIKPFVTPSVSVLIDDVLIAKR